jgi:hypothetical protein
MANYRILHGTWDGEFTICGKRVDDLARDEYVMDMEYNDFNNCYYRLKSGKLLCKFCDIEIENEAKLRRDKDKCFDDETDRPIL